jgi:ankyrin repeat protein
MLRCLIALGGMLNACTLTTTLTSYQPAAAPVKTVGVRNQPLLPIKHQLFEVASNPTTEEEWGRRSQARVHERQLLDVIFSHQQNGGDEVAEIGHLLDGEMVNPDCMGYGSQTFMQASFKPPLHMAVLVGNLAAVQLLLEHNANQSAAAYGLYIPAIFYAVGEAPAAFSPDWSGRASSGPVASILQLLITDCVANKRADCNLNHQERTELRSTTPLIAAVRNRYFDAAFLLIASGGGAVDLDLADDDGYTPLMHAAQLGHADLCNTLLKGGASISAADSRLGRTALHIAVVSRSAAVVKLLLGAVVDNYIPTDVPDISGLTPFDIAKQQIPPENSVLQQFAGAAEAGKTSAAVDCPLPHISITAPDAQKMVRQYMSLSQAFVLKTHELADEGGSVGLDELNDFVDRFGDLEVKVGDGPYAEKHGKGHGTTTISEFATSPEARDGKWIAFDNQFFENPANTELRAAMATQSQKWKVGASCGSQLGGSDGLGGSQLSFGLKGSGAHMHMHATAFNYLFFGEKLWTFDLRFCWPEFLERNRFYDAMGGRRNNQIMVNPKCGEEKEDFVLIRQEPRGDLQCVQRAGELMFVPKEWGHQTINLQPSLAVAQEFCDCVGTCCGSTCSATAALIGDDPHIVEQSDDDKHGNMHAMQAAINTWVALDPDLQ